MGDIAPLIKYWAFGLLLLLILQFIVFLYAYNKKRIDLVDVFWGISFIVISCFYTILNINDINVTTLVVLICVIVWGSRLSIHIFNRYKSRQNQDERYSAITQSFIAMPALVYVRVFAIQAVLASLVMIVFLAALLSTRHDMNLLIVGFVVWLFGLFFESTADRQLKRHVAEDSGSLMKTGLWKYSRHPNYFGELVQWWAIWLMVAGGTYALVGLIGPFSISILILFVSGIPPLEKHMASKKGWKDYKNSTSVLIPWL